MTKAEQKETKIYGLHACEAVFKNRPHDIIKAVLTSDRSKDFSAMLQYLAKNKKAYHIESAESLEKFAKSVHHEGICLIVKNANEVSYAEWLKASAKNKTMLLIALDNIDNPHNLGAIIRSASHFGVDAIFYTGKRSIHLDGATLRVSQGGSEYLKLFHIHDWNKLLDYCKHNNIVIFTTSDKSPKALAISSLKEKSLFVFGNEKTGLGQFWKNISNTIPVKIDGTNSVESLNISVACAITMALYRQKFPISV